MSIPDATGIPPCQKALSMPYSPVRTHPRDLFAFTAIALSVLALPGCRVRSAAPELRPAAEVAAVRVATATAQAREIPLTLAATGTLVPNLQSEVTPLVSGRVDAVFVERGSRVHAGDPLLRLRDVDLRTQASFASAALSQARARLGLADDNAHFDPTAAQDVRAAAANRDIADDALRRAEALVATGAMTDQEFQRTRSLAQAARSQYAAAVDAIRAGYFAYQQARAGVATASRAVADSIVRAPFDGEVAERKANVGEYVTVQRAVVTLVSLDPLRIEIQIPQERIADVRTGQAVEVRVDAYPNRVFGGTVRYISAAVRSDSRALVAEAMVPNTDGTLRPGLFATARIDLGEQREVVVVPARAVLDDSGTHRVYVIDGGRAVERVVTIADRTATEVLIERGVNSGERVATDGLDRLADGTHVREQQ